MAEYVTNLPLLGRVAPPPNPSLVCPAPKVASHIIDEPIDQAIASNLMQIAKPAKAGTPAVGQRSKQEKNYRSLSPAISLASLSSAASERSDWSDVIDLLKKQIEQQVERERQQAKLLEQFMAQQADRDQQQADREQKQAQTMAALINVIQNQTPRSSARSSRRASCRTSRQHSPDRHDTVPHVVIEDQRVTIKQEPNEVVALLHDRLAELAEEEQAQETDSLPDVPIHPVVAPHISTPAPHAHSQQSLQSPNLPVGCKYPASPEGPSLPNLVASKPPLTSPLKPKVDPAPPVHTSKENYPHPRTPIAQTQLIPLYRQINPYVEEITFPDFKKEDRAEYLELRMCLEILLTEAHEEKFKYALLLKHVKAPCAHSMVLAYAHSTLPYTEALAALDDRYGRPWDFILHELSEIEKLPQVKDDRALDNLSVRVQSLVGRLRAQQERGIHELHAGSNVERILAKLPKFRQEHFRHLRSSLPSDPDLSLIDLSNFLREEVRCLGLDPTLKSQSNSKDTGKWSKSGGQATTVMLQTDDSESEQSKTGKKKGTPPAKGKGKPACPYCKEQHWLHFCDSFTKLSLQDKKEWIETNRRCWRCARDTHKAADCDLKKKCDECGRTHLRVLHEVNLRDKGGTATSDADAAAEPDTDSAASPTTGNYYIDPAYSGSAKVMIKIVRVHLHCRNKMLDTYAVLDDGSETTLLLASAANQLGLQGEEETLTLRTISRDPKTIEGERVSLQITPAHRPDKRFSVQGVFTSKHIRLAQYNYPVKQLQERFTHLKKLPLPPITGATPTLLIGSDNSHLITPISVIDSGPSECPTAIETRLGWSLQGPIYSQAKGPVESSCFYSRVTPQERAEPLHPNGRDSPSDLQTLRPAVTAQLYSTVTSITSAILEPLVLLPETDDGSTTTPPVQLAAGTDVTEEMNAAGDPCVALTQLHPDVTPHNVRSAPKQEPCMAPVPLPPVQKRTSPVRHPNFSPNQWLSAPLPEPCIAPARAAPTKKQNPARHHQTDPLPYRHSSSEPKRLGRYSNRTKANRRKPWYLVAINGEPRTLRGYPAPKELQKRNFFDHKKSPCLKLQTLWTLVWRQYASSWGGQRPCIPREFTTPVGGLAPRTLYPSSPT